MAMQISFDILILTKFWTFQTLTVQLFLSHWRNFSFKTCCYFLVSDLFWRLFLCCCVKKTFWLFLRKKWRYSRSWRLRGLASTQDLHAGSFGIWMRKKIESRNPLPSSLTHKSLSLSFPHARIAIKFDFCVSVTRYGLILSLYSKVSNKRTVFNNRTGGDNVLQKFWSQLGPWAFPIP